MSIDILTPQELDRLRVSRPSTSKSTDNGGLSSPFLHLLATAGRELLSKVMTEQHYVPGQIIFKEDDIGDTMYIIWSGRAAVVKGAFQAPTILGYRGVGDIIGEMALLENQPRSASIVALEDLRALRVRRKDFEELLSNNPALGLSILGTLSARLREADDARKVSKRSETQLVRQVSELQTEKQRLVDQERLRQDTIDLIVHDLRHPVSSLLGALKILEMVLPEDVMQANQQLLNIANLNCESLQLMVDSLLDVARIEADQPHIMLEDIHLESLITEAVTKSQLAADMENITIQSVIPGDLPTISADPDKINRILSNLLNNAVKYSPADEEVTISAQAGEALIEVTVTDHGPGIPAEDRERVFDRFTQLTGSQPRTGGFGLGLAFCRLAIEAHGGQIWVEPETDEAGSRFIFTLPLGPPSAASHNHN